MLKWTILFLSTFVSEFVISQNIYSALQLNAETEYKTKRPKKIVGTTTFINPSGKQVEKSIKTFDDAGMLLAEERYNENGVLTARLTYTNDTINRIKLSRVFERWTQFGYSKETAAYTYNTNLFLVAVTDKNAAGNVIRQTNLVCNDKGHPIELTLSDANGNPFGKETATYLYNKNKVVTAVVTNDGRVLSNDTIKINFITASKFPGDAETYNSNGDLTNWIRRNINGSETIFEEEYTYDSFGNCTESKTFKVTIEENGRRKRKNDRITKKKYYY